MNNELINSINVSSRDRVYQLAQWHRSTPRKERYSPEFQDEFNSWVPDYAIETAKELVNKYHSCKRADLKRNYETMYSLLCWELSLIPKNEDGHKSILESRMRLISHSDTYQAWRKDMWQEGLLYELDHGKEVEPSSGDDYVYPDGESIKEGRAKRYVAFYYNYPESKPYNSVVSEVKDDKRKDHAAAHTGRNRKWLWKDEKVHEAVNKKTGEIKRLSPRVFGTIRKMLEPVREEEDKNYQEKLLDFKSKDYGINWYSEDVDEEMKILESNFHNILEDVERWIDRKIVHNASLILKYICLNYLRCPKNMWLFRELSKHHDYQLRKDYFAKGLEIMLAYYNQHTYFFRTDSRIFLNDIGYCTIGKEEVLIYPEIGNLTLNVPNILVFPFTPNVFGVLTPRGEKYANGLASNIDYLNNLICEQADVYYLI